MNPSSLTPIQQNAGQIALAAVLAIVGFACLLPRPTGRRIKEGIAASIASVVVFGAWLHSTYGRPMPDILGTVLFCLFSAGALGFGVTLVVQSNPGRGAIAFAFVILSTCGLFLLLAAPFLMAATIIIYAGAIIVTFLFVLMLSHASGPSNENDRSREPLLGSLAGFAFTGLVLFTLYLTNGGVKPAEAGEPAKIAQRLPATVLTPEERTTLLAVVAKLDDADAQLKAEPLSTEAIKQVADDFDAAVRSLALVVGTNEAKDSWRHADKRELVAPGSIRKRLEKDGPVGERPPLRTDEQAKATLRRTADVRKLVVEADKAVIENLYSDAARPALRPELRKLRDETLILAGTGDLPARNVANLGYLLYTEHLLAVELAGTLLLVATIGAIAIAQRKGATA